MTSTAAPLRHRRSLIPGLSTRPAPVVDSTKPAPGQAVARIDSRCLLTLGIVCRSCTDACEPRALRYRMLAGSAGEVSVDHRLCTGCGACVSTCPATAIRVSVDAAGIST